MRTFLKGIVVGIGGIAPGLSGSVLLVLFGLYEKALNAIGTLFKNFKKNMTFLVPLVLGFGVGVLLFSKVVDFLLTRFEMPTRYAFLGLVVGTLPMFFKEVRKKGFAKRYYFYIAAAFAVGILLFSLNRGLFQPVKNPNLLQSVFLGVAVAGSSIVPGVDSAVILSTLGLYELYVNSIANLNFSVLLPAAGGLIVGAFAIALLMNTLVKHFYTATFSVIFGLFLSIIPNVLNQNCVPGLNGQTAVSVLAGLLGLAVSLYFSNIQAFNRHIKALFAGKKQPAKL